MLYYNYPQVVLQEVPDEISLALSISGCNLNCKGCHSTETRDSQFGKPLTPDELQSLLIKHKHISCVLFYGGEWEEEYLIELLDQCSHLNTCLYTGLTLDKVSQKLIEKLTYLKVGPYIEHLGGLDSPNTNQALYKVNKNNLEDITFKLQ